MPSFPGSFLEERNMIWIIARREFLSNIITLRFLIAFALCLVLIMSSTYVLIDDYAARLKAYDVSVTEHVNAVKQMRVFSRLRAMIDRPPSKLSFLCVGSDRRMGNVTQVNYQRVPVEAIGGGGGNLLMVVSPYLDMILIIQVILSLLVLLFAYDTISGERERGTLAQVLSNSVPRHQLLMGKFVGGMMTVSLPLLVGLLAGLIVVWFSGDVALDAGDWVRLGLVVIASLLYISLFFTLGILISSLTGRSATSLVLLLFLWVVLVIIVPNVGPYVAKRMRHIRHPTGAKKPEAVLNWEMWESLRAYGEKLRREGMFPETLETYQDGIIEAKHLPYAYEISYAPKANLRWYLVGTKYRIPLELQCADKIWALYREYNKELERQLSLARFLSRTSPAWTYYNASSILSGTDVGNHLRFMDQARRYRQVLIDYARSKGGFSTLLYFTRMTMDGAPTTKEAEEMVKRMGQEGFRKKMMEYMKDVKPFDDIPVFHYEPEEIAGSLVRALPDLAILAILNVVLFMIAHVSFVRGRVK
jgi:ABC-type transport system involved in multi-copper enzyme maturation permease subunit